MLGLKGGKALFMSITRYEKAFAEMLGVSHAFSFYKGRVALYAILKALRVSEGDTVIFPGFTCIMVPNAAIYLGARPVYVDIEPESFNMDPVKLEAAIGGMSAAAIKRVKAIVVQHTFGIPADMDSVSAIADRYGIPVVEDCAHSIGSRYKGRLTGLMGVASFFSSQWSKPYSTGLGGMAATDSRIFGEKLRTIQKSFQSPGTFESALLSFQVSLHRHLFSPKLYWKSMTALRALSSAGLFIGSSSKEEHEGMMPDGYEKTMDEDQAGNGLVSLGSIEKDMAHRRSMAGFYASELAGIKNPVRVAEGSEPVFLRYPVLVDDKDAVLKEARLRSAEVGSWFETVLHPATKNLEQAGYIKGSCPVGEEVARSIVNLPTHPRVSIDDAKKSLSVVLRHLERPLRKPLAA
jgi:perosamine synthetase